MTLWSRFKNCPAAAVAAILLTPAVAPASPWAVAPDGAVVLDTGARLAWARCVEGMRWTGKTCAGTPLLLTRADASVRATERWTAHGTGWRLPRVPELQRLVDRTLNPARVNPRLFPAAPGGWHWTATANTSGRGGNPYNYNTIVQGQNASAAQAGLINGWAVDLSTGEARGDAARASKLPVRLVREALPSELPPP
jgi:hypothetical protein